jgi:hypothetical protein
MKEKIIDHSSKLLEIDKNVLEKIKKSDDRATKEKINIFKSYYSFIENEKCLKIIENMKDIFKKKIKIKEEDYLCLSIIILKSFIDKKIIGSTSEKFINSDDIFNYIVENYKFYILKSKKYYNKKETYSVCLYALDLLVNEKIIEQKIIRLQERPHIKTIKYYSLMETGYIKPISDYILFSYDNFNLIQFDDEYYISTYHYSKTFELFKKNFFSDKNFKIKNIEYVLNKVNIPLYIDDDYLKNLYKKINTDENIIYEEIKRNTERINNLFNNDNWTSITKKKIAEIQSENAKLLDNLIYIYFSKLDFGDTPIFFPMFLDFRGRKYYHSKVGPTSSKILRLCFFYGWYKNKEFIEKDNIYSRDYYEKIDVFCKNNKINRNRKYFEVYFWALIGIGKFYVEKEKYPINVDEFLDKGIENFKNDLNKMETSDYLEIKHYSTIILQMNQKKIKKRTIIKDATASLNQILMKVLGPLNQNSMNYVNLGQSWGWYDTYLVSRELYYDKIIKIESLREYHDKIKFSKVMSRSLIKNSIMIIPYSAGNSLCWENYIKKIKDKKYDIKIDKNLKKLMISFFNFIREEIQEMYLYDKKNKEINEKTSEKFEKLRSAVLESNTGIADISYYKMKRSSIDKKYKLNGEEKRVTKLILTPSMAIDKKAFDIAVGANTVHFLDADEIREIEKELEYCVITIHDSYLIDIKNCSKLIKIKQEHYQKKIDDLGKKYHINNIFILL